LRRSAASSSTAKRWPETGRRGVARSLLFLPQTGT